MENVKPSSERSLKFHSVSESCGLEQLTLKMFNERGIAVLESHFQFSVDFILI